jgi:hypothetical protein
MSINMDGILAEVDKVKNMCKEGLDAKCKDGSIPLLTHNSILKKVSEIDKKILEKCLGNFGKRLKNFTDFYDITHPHVAGMFGSISYRNVSEILDVIKVAENSKENLDGLYSLTSSAINDNTNLKFISTSLSNVPIRVLKDKVDREYARVAGNHNIDVEKGERIHRSPSEMILFSQIPVSAFDFSKATNSFETFVRLSVPNTQSIELSLNKLMEMGLIHQADIYKKKINDIKSRSYMNYCGFRRINISEASAILGKVHGYQCPTLSSKIGLDYDDPKILALFKFIMPSAAFSKLIHEYFGTDRHWDRLASIIENISNIMGSKNAALAKDVAGFYEFLISRHRINLFEFQPRLYPLHAFKSVLSDEVNKTIDKVEEFEEFYKKPLFDKFFVLIPSVSFESSYFCNDTSGKFRFKSKDKDRLIELPNKDEAFFVVDSFLMKQKLIYPILLGKKDADYYFINYMDFY